MGDPGQLLLQDELLILCLRLLKFTCEQSVFFDLLVEHYRYLVNLTYDKI